MQVDCNVELRCCKTLCCHSTEVFTVKFQEKHAFQRNLVEPDIGLILKKKEKSLYLKFLYKLILVFCGGFKVKISEN